MLSSSSIQTHRALLITHGAILSRPQVDHDTIIKPIGHQPASLHTAAASWLFQLTAKNPDTTKNVSTATDPAFNNARRRGLARSAGYQECPMNSSAIAEKRARIVLSRRRGQRGRLRCLQDAETEEGTANMLSSGLTDGADGVCHQHGIATPGAHARQERCVQLDARGFHDTRSPCADITLRSIEQ